LSADKYFSYRHHSNTFIIKAASSKGAYPSLQRIFILAKQDHIITINLPILTYNPIKIHFRLIATHSMSQDQALRLIGLIQARIWRKPEYIPAKVGREGSYHSAKTRFCGHFSMKSPL
jgi:hypothetical protein